MRPIKIINGRVITPNYVLHNATVLLSAGRIAAIGEDLPDHPEALVLDAAGDYVAPGFIDLHVHGGGGHDFMDGTEEAFHAVARLHARHGTTAMTPTTLSCEAADLYSTLETYERLSGQPSPGARFIGMHLEGPYFAMNQRGAQDPRFIRNPDPAEYKALTTRFPGIRRWSAAPELPGALEFADWLVENGILAAWAHTDAIYEDIVVAFQRGYTLATHLYSAMLGVTRRGASRFAGAVEAAFLIDDMAVEIIADGIHLPPPLLKLVCKLKGPGKIALITDAMRGAGMPPGESLLGGKKNGLPVIIEDGVAKLPDRSAFAGSVATADRLVRNMIRLADQSVEDAVRMMSTTPAEIMGVAGRKGSLEPGKDADVVIFDDEINIRNTIVGGNIIYTALLAFFLLVMGSLRAEPTPFAVRAFHLDLRIQVMTMPALKTFVRDLHAGGINTLIMEYEATYPFEKHPLIGNRYAYTKKEITGFITFCSGLNIDVIPLQQSFGHVEYILRHQRYAPLREDEKALSQICPLKVMEDSLLFTDLYTELASAHPSPYIHIGCDETYLLGHCERCRRKVAEEGVSKLYIDYVSMLCRIVLRLGKKPVLWADMVLKYPEAVRSLPPGTILVDWNYGWSLDHFGDHQKLLASGYTIWGAPAIRSSPDNFYLTRWEYHFGNIRDFVPACRQMGYSGMVLTSWSTSGAYSYLYESENSLSELFAIRHVYPITGFHILTAAYIESIQSAEALDIPRFITSYCAKQYGFTRNEALAFWQALRTAPYEVTEGNVQSHTPLTLKALLDSCTAAAATLRKLQPKRNQSEFEHYRLMADIRVQHLRFVEIEAESNDPAFTPLGIPALLARLKTLLDEDTGLSQRFILLNKGAFYLPELESENRLRTEDIRLLYARLGKAR